MAGCNEENCTCPKVECERHGKCCECINHHRKPGMPPLVFCLRNNGTEGAAQAKS